MKVQKKKKKCTAPLAFLNSRECALRFCWTGKKTFGLIDPNKDDEISINLYNILSYFYIHEWLHHIHPEWEEKSVEEATNRYTDRLSVDQINKLGRRLLDFWITQQRKG